MSVFEGKVTYTGGPLSTVNQPQSILLKSGQTWVPQPGTYLFKPGPALVVQYFDSYTGLWRNWDTALANTPIQADGSNIRLINPTGCVEGVNITNAGTGYGAVGTTFPVTFGSAPTNGVAAAGTAIVGGALSLTLTTAGTGYTNPQIIIPPPQFLGGAVGASLPAVAYSGLSSGALSGLTLTFAGAGYVTAPSANTVTITPAQYAANPALYNNGTSIVIIDPAGSGAVITPALAGSGTVTGVIVTNNGANYLGTSIPTVSFSGGAGSSAAGTAVMNFSLLSVTVGGTNTGYTGTPIGISSCGLLVSQIGGETFQPRPARMTFGLTSGAITSTNIEDAGVGLQSVPTISTLYNAGNNATFTAVVGGANQLVQYYQVG